MFGSVRQMFGSSRTYRNAQSYLTNAVVKLLATASFFMHCGVYVPATELRAYEVGTMISYRSLVCTYQIRLHQYQGHHWKIADEGLPVGGSSCAVSRSSRNIGCSLVNN